MGNLSSTPDSILTTCPPNQRIIVFAEDEEDVSNTIKFVGKHNLDVAAACGRHSYHGASSSTGLVLGKNALEFC